MSEHGGKRFTEYLALDEIKPARRNPKKHDRVGISSSIDSYGMVEPIVLDERTGRLVAGHGRREALLRRKKEGSAAPAGVEVAGDGSWLVPVQRGWASRDDKEAEAYLLASNQLTMAGGWNSDELSQLVRELHSTVDLTKIGFSNADLGQMLAELGRTPAQDVDTVPPTPKVATSKSGEIWTLGRHRIACGDSSDHALVNRLFAGDKRKASMMATDPPYGVAYGDETGQAAGERFGVIANDENDGPKLQEFLQRVFGAALAVLEPNAAWYLWHAQMTQGYFAAAAAAAAQVLIHRQIVWAKPSLVLGHGDFHWQHELCFYGWRQGHRAKWYGDRKQTTLWSIGRENDGIHPTQKPVEIFARAMRLSTLPGDIVYEPFSGSGTQIVAAETNDRICRAIEIDPIYVDVAIQRWESLTSGKAERIAA